MVAGTSTVSVGRSRAIAVERRVRREARVQRDGRAQLQRRRGLDVEPADVEQRQHGQHMIVAPSCRACAGSSRRSRPAPPGAAPRPSAGRWCRRCRRSAAGRRDRRAGCGRRRLRRQQASNAMRDGAKSRPTMRTSGSACVKRRDNGAKACSTTSALRRRIGEDEHLLGHREPPVERHQHRAEPRAGVEQHQIVGMIQARIATRSPRPTPSSCFQRARGRSMRAANAA